MQLLLQQPQSITVILIATSPKHPIFHPMLCPPGFNQ
jgi:hypothetical protein